MTTVHGLVGHKSKAALAVLLGLLASGGWDSGQASAAGESAAAVESPQVEQEKAQMWMTVGTRRFAITLTSGAAARAFAAQLPLTIEMRYLLDRAEARGETTIH